jgi:7-cyano-7-deazaguanine synthase
MKEQGVQQYPLFVNYGQLAYEREWEACKAVHRSLDLTVPECLNISDYGRVIPSGLTSRSLDPVDNAFLPGRNLLFLLVGAAYAYETGLDSVSIGLLSDDAHIFPDQTQEFVRMAESSLSAALGKRIRVIAPLMEFSKAEVLVLAKQKGLPTTYSCHVGLEAPCGRCISCMEREGAMKQVSDGR